MNRIRQLRLAFEMKQSDLAKRLHVGQNTISNWENGKTEPDSNALQAMARLFSSSIDYILGHSGIRDTTVQKAIRIPVYSELSSDLSDGTEENVIGYEDIDAIRASGGEYFGLCVRGNSMEPRIREGDVIIAVRQDHADTGDIVIVQISGGPASIYRIKKETSGLSLIPNNPVYDIRYFSTEEIKNLPVKIIGKAVELRAKF